jgi:hypothetical protein
MSGVHRVCCCQEFDCDCNTSSFAFSYSGGSSVIVDCSLCTWRTVNTGGSPAALSIPSRSATLAVNFPFSDCEFIASTTWSSYFGSVFVRECSTGNAANYERYTYRLDSQLVGSVRYAVAYVQREFKYSPVTPPSAATVPDFAVRVSQVLPFTATGCPPTGDYAFNAKLGNIGRVSIAVPSSGCVATTTVTAGTISIS